MLPELTVNRHFMSEFIAAGTPCLALGLIEEGAAECALVALRLDRVIPRAVSAAGFAFGHALIGTPGWEVVHFGFEFYGFATCNVLINPSNPTAQAVLNIMIETGDYFFLALNTDRSATAFRSEIGKSSLAGLRANMSRIRTSTTTDAQYRSAVSQFARRPEPLGTLLTWVCQDNAGALDLAEDRLVLRPA